MGIGKTFGFPQGLFYWEHEELWRIFFSELKLIVWNINN